MGFCNVRSRVIDSEFPMLAGHMSKKAVTKLTVLVCGFLTASSAAAIDNFEKLSGAQIRTRLAGMELTDEVHWREAYVRDGSFKSSSMGRTRVGKWRIEEDELCVDLGDQADSGCYEVWLAGKKVELRPTGRGLTVQGVLQKPAGRN
jgi:hypothetical protein